MFMGEIIRTYIYYEMEGEEKLYLDLDKIFMEDEQYKSDLMSLKALGLHRIVAKQRYFHIRTFSLIQ